MLTRDETIARLATIVQITDDEYIEHGAYAAAFYLRGSVPKLDVAPLVEAVRELLSHRVGDLPSLGYIRDNDASRKSIGKLAIALTTIDAKERDE